MVQKKKEKATKVKKKKWYPIIAPKLFNNSFLGETLLTESSLAKGKPIVVNLMNLTNDIKKQNFNIKFIVDKVENDKAHTKIIGYMMVPSSIRRLTRRRSDKIENSFVCKTSDNIRIRIKPLIFTRSVTNNSIRNAIIKTSQEVLTRNIGKTKFDELITGLVNGKVQTSLRSRLSKIYPIRNIQIKYMAIEESKKYGGVKEEPLVVENQPQPKEEEKKPEEKEEKLPDVKEDAKEEPKEEPKVEEKKEKAPVEEDKPVTEEKKKEEPPKEEVKPKVEQKPDS